ncbi:diphthine synthase [Candidatus Woesearchaeota archaeon]|nr:diphthine synthase [Candidatus Woesearchaeota archaeon]
MTLYLIGLGLYDENDISVRGRAIIKKCQHLYLEHYTSLLSCPVEKLEQVYGKSVKVANREMVEHHSRETILADAQKMDTAFLVVGDPLAATTHMSLYLEATAMGIPCIIVHNASVLTAVGITGLQIYKFGKVTSIPFSHEQVETPLRVLKDNLSLGLHTLFLLDLNLEEKKFVTISDALTYILKQSSILKTGQKKIFTKQTKSIGCARLGSDHPTIVYGTREELSTAPFGQPPYCLIVPGKLHFMEEEALELWKPKAIK